MLPNNQRSRGQPENELISNTLMKGFPNELSTNIIQKHLGFINTEANLMNQNLNENEYLIIINFIYFSYF